MKRYLGSLVAAVAVLMAAGIPVANARPGGGFGGWHGSGHGHFRGGLGFYWGGPLWYPYSWPYYSYYDYPYYYNPPPYGYSYPPAYVSYAPRYYPENNAPRYSQDDGRDYLTLGHDSGKALRLKSVSRDWLVEYLRFYVINAPTSVKDDFRRGFISGYGEDGESMYKKALQDAGQQAPPPPPPARNDAPPASEATAPDQKP